MTTTTTQPLLRASGLRKAFRMGDTEVPVLKSVDLSIRPGEFVAIEGRSGSGKSTLLHILAGLDAPDSGKIEFEDKDIAELSISTDSFLKGLRDRSLFGMAPILETFGQLWDLLTVSLNRADPKLARVRNESFGFVFQFYHLLPELNVLENTLLAPMAGTPSMQYRSHRTELMNRAVDVLTQMNMQHRLHHRPGQLSGGERQRVAIARALMNSPRILFADEPTGNLDFETGKQIMGVLEKLHREQNQTIVMVTHDRAIARQADRVLVLKDGGLARADA
jgi:lipoprotein-releasing system ATP-binding protein